MRPKLALIFAVAVATIISINSISPAAVTFCYGDAGTCYGYGSSFYGHDYDDYYGPYNYYPYGNYYYGHDGSTYTSPNIVINPPIIHRYYYNDYDNYYYTRPYPYAYEYPYRVMPRNKIYYYPREYGRYDYYPRRYHKYDTWNYNNREGRHYYPRDAGTRPRMRIRR